MRRWLVLLLAVLPRSRLARPPSPPVATPAATPASPALAAVLAAARAGSDVPGLAAAVFRCDAVLDEAVDGVRRADRPDPVTPDDPFHLGSNVKAMTATMIATLVEEGTLRVVDPAGRRVAGTGRQRQPRLRRRHARAAARAPRRPARLGGAGGHPRVPRHARGAAAGGHGAATWRRAGRARRRATATPTPATPSPPPWPRRRRARPGRS